MYLYKHILKSSVTMLRALYADFDACFEHYMYILKALLKALKRDFSSIIRRGLVRLQRILSFGNENCFLVAMVGSNAVYLSQHCCQVFCIVFVPRQEEKQPGKKMNNFCFRLIVDNTTLTSLTIMKMNTY